MTRKQCKEAVLKVAVALGKLSRVSGFSVTAKLSDGKREKCDPYLLVDGWLTITIEEEEVQGLGRMVKRITYVLSTCHVTGPTRHSPEEYEMIELGRSSFHAGAAKLALVQVVLTRIRQASESLFWKERAQEEE